MNSTHLWTQFSLLPIHVVFRTDKAYANKLFGVQVCVADIEFQVQINREVHVKEHSFISINLKWESFLPDSHITYTIPGYLNKLCICHSSFFYVSISCLVEDDKNNQFLQNDGTSQKLSRDEIMNLKAQGVSGKVN